MTYDIPFKITATGGENVICCPVLLNKCYFIE